jgi:pimeloyl-ACP methyl ester carboxylesterase
MVERSFALVHSPHVGPVAWSLVAGELARSGHWPVVPSFQGLEGRAPTYLAGQVEIVLEAIRKAALEDPIWLVAHDWAGLALPSIAAALAPRVAGCIFVDGKLPQSGGSPIGLLHDPRAAEALRRAIENPMLLAWSSPGLEELIPQATVRERFLDEFPYRPMAYYEEQVAIPAGWPNAPCGYLRLSAPYRDEAAKAASLGWPVIERDGRHFDILAEPGTVAGDLLDLVAKLEERAEEEVPGVTPAHVRRALEVLDAKLRAEFGELRVELDRLQQTLEGA